MTPARKTDAIPGEAATLALWRAAETGDLVELESLLPRADVNACNEHGVTALMRAAQNGHVKIVRALLQNGADANVKRNDKFTALALAAFFGHTEVVRTLMEFGADSQAATRHDTSPQMWANARTFNAVVKSLQKQAAARPEPVALRMPASVRARVSEPEPKPVPAPAPETSAPRPVSTEIRTLKQPPEIWDLVHEVPRRFDARSAFMARFQSLRRGWAFRVAAGMIVVAMGVVGVLVLRSVQARSERNSARQAEASPQAPVQIEKANAASNSQAISNNGWQAVSEGNSQTATAPLPTLSNVPPATIGSSDAAVTVRKGARAAFLSSHRAWSGATRRDVADEVVQPANPVAEKSDPAPRPVVVANKPATPAPLSPQLISPPKSATPKGKVIQWP